MRAVYCGFVVLVALQIFTVESWAQSRSFGASSSFEASSSFGGAMLGRPNLGRAPSGGSIIGDGRSGFRVYTPEGSGRFIDSGAGGGRIYGPGNRSSVVIGDGLGNATAYGPGGARTLWGKRGPGLTRPLSGSVLDR